MDEGSLHMKSCTVASNADRCSPACGLLSTPPPQFNCNIRCIAPQAASIREDISHCIAQVPCDTDLAWVKDTVIVVDMSLQPGGANKFDCVH